MEAVIYNQKGAEAGKVKLPDDVFGVAWNGDLVHEVVTSMMSNQRTPIAHTKNRGDVSGTGKKPWRQKGTGRARHGSRRSPIWVGGGVAHGPRNERDYSKKINKKVKTKALFVALSKKLNDNEIIFVDSLSIKEPKTKEAKSILSSLAKIKGYENLNRRKNATFISLAEKDMNVKKSFNNFGNLEVGEVKDLNILDLLNYKFLIITNPDKSIANISGRIK